MSENGWWMSISKCGQQTGALVLCAEVLPGPRLTREFGECFDSKDFRLEDSGVRNAEF
jgi:hypothetical protein